MTQSNPAIASRFLTALESLRGSDRAGGALLACSGGSDSGALAALAAAVGRDSGWDFRIVHLDHGLRSESCREAAAVRSLAEKLGLPCICRDLPLRRTLDREGGNMEATARRLRYDALARLAREQACSWVLTGHSADDLAETLWLWLLRGTGLRGLAPLPGRRPLDPTGDPAGEIQLLRPLLGFRRAELQDYLRDRGIPWLEDPSNADLSLRRNRIRHRLLPFLAEEFDIDPVSRTRALVGQTAQLSRFLDEELGRRGLAEACAGDPPWTLDRRALAALPGALAAWLLSGALASPKATACGETAGPSSRGGNLDAEVGRILALNLDGKDAATGKVLHLSGGLQARFTVGELVLERRSAPPRAPAHLVQAELPPEGLELLLPESGQSRRQELGPGWTLILTRRPGPAAIPDNADRAVFDLASLRLPLRLGHPAPGQRLRPLGGPGSRKLSDLFVDRKVPRPFRSRVPLLLDAVGQVIWIPGLGRGDAAPIADGTRETLGLDLEGTSS